MNLGNLVFIHPLVPTYQIISARRSRKFWPCNTTELSTSPTVAPSTANPTIVNTSVWNPQIQAISLPLMLQPPLHRQHHFHSIINIRVCKHTGVGCWQFVVYLWYATQLDHNKILLLCDGFVIDHCYKWARINAMGHSIMVLPLLLPRQHPPLTYRGQQFGSSKKTIMVLAFIILCGVTYSIEI